MASKWWPFGNSQYSDPPWFSADSQRAYSPISNDSPPQKLVFYCQLAHGSPTAIIQDFATVQELYKRIAEAFEIPSESILFCTLNTYKLEMNCLLGSAVSPEDFIFVHVAGQPKELELLKTESSLGLTITDNGDGMAFVKAIQPGSIVARHGAILTGDHIQKINGQSVVGMRHYDVAARLREIEIGNVITLRVVSPLTLGFSMIGPVHRGNNKVSLGNRLGADKAAGRKTLRFRADGRVLLEDEVQPDEEERRAIAKVDSLLDSYLGVSDVELATQFWSLAKQASNPAELCTLIDNADAGLKQFSFGLTTFPYDLWGVVTDMKRPKSHQLKV